MQKFAILACIAPLISSVVAFTAPNGVCKFNADSFTGGWYEIASSAYVGETVEKDCICPAAYYTTNEKNSSVLDLTNSCIRNGNFYSVSGKINPAPPGEPQGNLRVVLDSYNPNTNTTNNNTAPNYMILKEYARQNQTNTPQYVLVGGDNENYWWLLSRSPNWDDYIWYNVNYLLQAHEYNVTGFRVPEQTCQFLGGHGKNNLIPPSG